MNILATSYIFEMLPKENLVHGKAGLWKNVPQGKLIPYVFVRAFQLIVDVMLLSVVVVIGLTTHMPGGQLVGMELLFMSAYSLLLIARISKKFLFVIGIYLSAMVLGVIINLVFPGTWGSVIFYALFVIMFYRFPLRWSLSLALMCIFLLITTGGGLRLLSTQHPGNLQTLVLNLGLAAALCWFGWTRRTQYLLVVRLHETQEQLREQMVRSEELATERERTRIARDIHDVLSHSLAVLSIQVQAARQLVTRDPERLTSKLDDMAMLIRESITESRHVVGLLREKPAIQLGQDDLGVSLCSIANTFSERTGIHCRLEESGTPHRVSSQQRETLQLALREMLTNAHRHGAAQMVWVTWRWREASIILEVRDDGIGTNAVINTPVAKADTGGHHGLQGMRERATVLGGEVEAGPAETGGFMVTLRLPLEQPNNKSV